jgi:hypothetical protein
MNGDAATPDVELHVGAEAKSEQTELIKTIQQL